MTRLTSTERIRAYGHPGHADKVRIPTPWGIPVMCHRLVVDVFTDACNEAAATVAWRPLRIDSYNYRTIRDSAEPSLHGWPLAWDFFATPPNVPPPGGVWTPDDGVPADFAACFTRRGFTWGATWARKDVPHIEWAGPPPGPVTHTIPPEVPDMTPEQEAKLDTVIDLLVRLLHFDMDEFKPMADQIHAAVRQELDATTLHNGT